MNNENYIKIYLIAEKVMQLKIYLYAVSNQNRKSYINQQAA